jgi:hypothetical protein
MRDTHEAIEEIPEEAREPSSEPSERRRVCFFQRIDAPQPERVAPPRDSSPEGLVNAGDPCASTSYRFLAPRRSRRRVDP